MLLSVLRALNIIVVLCIIAERATPNIAKAIMASIIPKPLDFLKISLIFNISCAVDSQFS